MKKITFCLALCSLTFGQVSRAPHKPTSAKPGAAKKMAARRPLQRFVPGSFIVELSGESVVTSVKSASAKIGRLADHEALTQQHRSRVAREQALIRPTLEAKGAHVHHSVDLVMNAMMVKYAGK